jgi:hypothetical protein
MKIQPDIDVTAKMVFGWGMKIVIGLVLLLNSLMVAVGKHYINQLDNLQELAQINAVQHAEIYTRLNQPQPRHVTVRKSVPNDYNQRSKK